jgi:hypothetical protein
MSCFTARGRVLRSSRQRAESRSRRGDAGNFVAELSCSEPEWIICEVGVALRRAGIRVPEQPPDNLEAQPAADKVRFRVAYRSKSNTLEKQRHRLSISGSKVRALVRPPQKSMT